MTREVEMGSHLFVWSGMPNISKMLSETLSQHPARFTYIQFTTFETHNNINYIFRSARKRVFDLGAATGAHNLSGVVDVWAGDTAGTTTRESARYHRLGNSAPHK